jgi:hypothetical protein
MGDATFLQRLFIGWNRLRVVKEKVDGQRISRILKSGTARWWSCNRQRPLNPPIQQSWTSWIGYRWCRSSSCVPGIAQCFGVFRQSRSSRICSGTASRTEFKEKAYDGFSRSAQPPARSDDKGIGVKVLLAIWAAQPERERLKYQFAGHAVWIEPGLLSVSPKNGNISNISRRLSTISR